MKSAASLKSSKTTTNLVGMTDLEGKFFFVNPNFHKALGYPKEELLGKHFSVIVAASNSPELVQELPDATSPRLDGRSPASPQRRHRTFGQSDPATPYR